VLLVCRQHRRPAFVHIAEPRWYTPRPYIRTHCTSATITAGYLRTCCSSAVYIVDLRSYALQKLVGTHCSPTFVRAARMQSTPLTCVRTRCRTSLVHTAVLHSYMLHVCRHYRWLHWYALVVCCQHRRPAFVRVAKPRCYPLLSYIRTCCSSAVYIVDLRSYSLQKLIGTHCSPTFVRAARMWSTLLTCVRTRCGTSSVHTADLHSYMLRVCRHYRWLHSYALLVYRQHRRPAFVRVAEPRWYTPLSYIRTCCSSAVYIVDLHSYSLQKLIGTHCSPTFVRAARMWSTLLTCVRTRCGTSSVHTADLHSYMLRVCRHYRWLHSYALLVCRQHRRPAFVRVAEPRWYTPLSYIRIRCTSTAITAGYIRTRGSSAINIVDLCSYSLQNLVAIHCCPTFVRAACLPSTSSTCVRTRCRSSLVPTALLHSYALLVCGQHC